MSERSQTDPLFENVLAEILQAEEQGKPIDLDRYARSFPQLEGQLRDYFANREGFDRAAPCLRPLAPPAETPPPGGDTHPPGASHPSPGDRVAGFVLLGEL